MPAKVITEILDKYATAPKSNMQALEDHELSIVFEHLTQNNQVSSIAAIYADEPKKPEPPKAPVKAPEPPKAAQAPAAAPEQSVLDDNARRITEFLTGLLEHMDSPAQVQVTETEKGRYSVVLEGQKLGQLIGRRGETLDAIQQLTNYAVNSGREKRIRVHVDAENYRAKREQSLESLARKVAAKVTRYRRSVTLEPMNAYERHVIHAALQDVPGVNTYSIGSEPNRRVVVSYDRDKR